LIQVAVKVIEKDNIKTNKQRVSVDREVRLMKLLNHPNIVSVIEVFDTNKQILMVMEHAANGELFEYIVKNGSVKELQARQFFRQIISAVDYLHMVVLY
jgi:serine/threonine protein kinase